MMKSRSRNLCMRWHRSTPCQQTGECTKPNKQIRNLWRNCSKHNSQKDSPVKQDVGTKIFIDSHFQEIYGQVWKFESFQWGLLRTMQLYYAIPCYTIIPIYPYRTRRLRYYKTPAAKKLDCEVMDWIVGGGVS